MRLALITQERTPTWLFQPTDHHGRVLTKCFQMLGMMFQIRTQKTKELNDVRKTCQFALSHLDETYQAIDALSRMTPEERCSALGVKSISTDEEHRALGLKALAGVKMLSEERAGEIMNARGTKSQSPTWVASTRLSPHSPLGTTETAQQT